MWLINHPLGSGGLFDPFEHFFGKHMGDFPQIDVSETPKEVIIKADLPGTDPKNIKIQLNDNILTMKGEVQEEKEEKEKHFYRKERRYGSFQRGIALPCPCKKEGIEAKFKNGTLKITLKKEAPEKGKPIPIEVEE